MQWGHCILIGLEKPTVIFMLRMDWAIYLFIFPPPFSLAGGGGGIW